MGNAYCKEYDYSDILMRNKDLAALISPVFTIFYSESFHRLCRLCTRHREKLPLMEKLCKLIEPCSTTGNVFSMERKMKNTRQIQVNEPKRLPLKADEHY